MPTGQSRDLEREPPISDSVEQGCRCGLTPRRKSEVTRLARETETTRDCEVSRVRSFVKVCRPKEVLDREGSSSDGDGGGGDGAVEVAYESTWPST